MHRAPRRGGKVRVHWRYLPDSYDEWLPAAVAPARPDPPAAPEGPWKVGIRCHIS